MKNNKDLWLSILVMILWGSLFPFVKIGYTAFNIITTADILLFAGVRFTVCGLIITLYCIIKDKKLFLPAKASLVPILWSGVFAIILHYSFTYIGLSMTDSSKTAILKQVGVLLYVCFSFLFFKEDKLTMRKFIGAVLGFSGIVAINASFTGLSFHVGDLFVLAASFCTVFSNVISKRVFLATDPIVATGISQLFGGIILLAAGKLFNGSMTPVSGISFAVISYICFASIISYCIWFTVVKRGELSKLFIVKFAEPVFACIFSSVLLKENIFKVQYLVSFILIVIGIYIANMNKKKPSVFKCGEKQKLYR